MSGCLFWPLKHVHAKLQQTNNRACELGQLTYPFHGGLDKISSGVFDSFQKPCPRRGLAHFHFASVGGPKRANCRLQSFQRHLRSIQVLIRRRIAGYGNATQPETQKVGENCPYIPARVAAPGQFPIHDSQTHILVCAV